MNARVIAQFARAVFPPVHPVLDARARRLANLVTRRRQLVDMLGAETSRSRLTCDRGLQRRLDAHILWRQRAPYDLETDLHEAIQATP